MPRSCGSAEAPGQRSRLEQRGYARENHSPAQGFAQSGLQHIASEVKNVKKKKSNENTMIPQFPLFPFFPSREPYLLVIVNKMLGSLFRYYAWFL